MVPSYLYFHISTHISTAHHYRLRVSRKTLYICIPTSVTLPIYVLMRTALRSSLKLS